ncbi:MULTISPECIES: CsgG/HfaB family protein [Shewanella]|uniref:Curli production assembly/transport component CsgG n=1 Tax=Shewanella baltica (strain OS195) TaxID=399599 RepID=A9L616_SHEB9|nr:MULTISPECIES: CsgG/HfaB family protein [Shewanella]ABX51281.1 Curli production assembly/transport component CsgG [Shewanella baltica OS195]ADT96282.1 Curli production assembly/transport component CsgG [Shewanella baltica OS678]AUD58791.1 curli production assembly protein CsgG [Shewanella sp. Pdp11]
MNKALPLIFVMCASLTTACATVNKKQVVTTAQPAAAISATQTEVALNTKLLKRKVAIGRFTNETTYGQGFFIDEDNNRIGKQAMDILSSKLFQTGKFIMLERADLGKIEKELAMGGNSTLKNAADYLIVGSITEFGRKEVSDVGVFSRVKKQEANAKVNIRIVDVATGLIIYSEEGKGIAYSEAGSVMGVGDKAGYDSSLNDKVLDVAITNLASNIIENMLDKPWQSYILSYEEGSLIISGGSSQNITPGTLFEIIKEGKKVKNPQTGMFITLPGKAIGTIEVTASFGNTPESEVSFGTIVSGNLDQYIKDQDYTGLFIQEMK